jgi:imidazolonepropionase-like amidohydrolase
MLGMKADRGDCPGAYADIVAVPGDPLRMRVLEKVGFVMKDGKIFRDAMTAR